MNTSKLLMWVGVSAGIWLVIIYAFGHEQTGAEVAKGISDRAPEFMEKCMTESNGTNLEGAKQLCAYKLMAPLREWQRKHPKPATVNVRMPDGVIVTNVPADTTQEDLQKAYDQSKTK